MDNSFLVITVHDGLVHVQLEREFYITLDSMRDMWREIVSTCKDHDVRRILIDCDRPIRAMKKHEACEHGRIVADSDLDNARIAFCLHSFEIDQLSYLFTMVANGSSNVARVFNSSDEAVEWLESAGR